MSSSNSNDKEVKEKPRAAPLPEAVIQALETMEWKLTDAPPMHYKSLEEMATLRTSSINVVEAVQTLHKTAPVQNSNTEYLARIATSLLLLGNGYTDEAHNLVLSLSWRGELPYAYGPPVNVKSEHVQVLACYAHCLVHRLEGPHPSEFSMTGFQNSDFWSGHTMRNLEGLDELPLTPIKKAISNLVDCEDAQHWMEQTLVNATPSWDPRFLTELCRRVVAHGQQAKKSDSKEDDGDMTHHPLHDFCTKAALVELKILLGHVLTVMGFVAP